MNYNMQVQQQQILKPSQSNFLMRRMSLVSIEKPNHFLGFSQNTFLSPRLMKLPNDVGRVTGQGTLERQIKINPRFKIGRRKMRSIASERVLVKQQKLSQLYSFEKKTLILDLDETLVKVTNGDIYDVELPGSPCLFLLLRPYLRELLEYASKVFHLILFTASTKTYADRILQFIDPLNSCFKERYYRDDCIKTSRGFVKDMTLINIKDWEKVIMVDDQSLSFENQPLNGLKILPWDGNCKDFELKNLINFLRTVERSEDVRVNIQALKMN